MASRTTITVASSAESYPIWVGQGNLTQIGHFVQELQPATQKILIVTDTNVAPLYLQSITDSLIQVGFTVSSIAIESGETHKTIKTLEQLYDSAIHASLKRRDCIIALGGGITGDITGFFASTYLRGIPFIQIPTTLLAQVDASVGGKVAVNWKHLKNMVGAFYHPKGVLIDTNTLNTLPKEEFICGMGEVIKYSLIEKSVPSISSDTLFFQRLNITSQESESRMEDIIRYCCQLKASVVESDPKEQLGIREILNLGHTFGHAYETLSSGSIPHGKAVSIGIVKAFSLASVMQQISPNDLEEVTALLKQYDLPVESPIYYAPHHLIEVMSHDKKSASDGSLRLVLPYETIGKVRIQKNIPIELAVSIL